MLDDCWRYLYTIWRSSVAIAADRDLEIDPRMLKVFPYVLRIFPCMFYPCMLKVLPRMLRIFPHVVVLAAWPWHSHTIFWSCRLVLCPILRLSQLSSHPSLPLLGHSSLRLFPLRGPASLRSCHIISAQLAAFPTYRPFFPASSWPISARGLSQLVASHGLSARSLSNMRLPPLVASPEAPL